MALAGGEAPCDSKSTTTVLPDTLTWALPASGCAKADDRNGAKDISASTSRPL